MQSKVEGWRIHYWDSLASYSQMDSLKSGKLWSSLSCLVVAFNRLGLARSSTVLAIEVESLRTKE